MKILIIDDHPLVAEGIAGLLAGLADDITTHVVPGGKQGIASAIEQKPDLILLDLHMPEMGGLEALGLLGEKLPTTSVVIVSGSLEKSDMEAAIQLGAMGFIPKSSSPAIMRNALQLVIGGGIYIPPEMINMGNHQVAAKQQFTNDNFAIKQHTTNHSLTPRQFEVLRLLSEGKVNKEIARELDCAETTVKAHVRAVFKELNARNRTEAVINAKKMGLIG